MDQLYLPLWAVVAVLGAALALGLLLAPWARGQFTGRPESEAADPGPADPEGADDGAPDADADADADEESTGTAREFGYITGPIVTITSLLLSFSLVNVWGSFQEAARSANLEAVAVDYQSDMAQLLPDKATGRGVEATLVCYARAIAGAEWRAMAERGESTAPEVDPWTDHLQEVIGKLSSAPAGGGYVGRELTAADRERGTARSQRLTQARVSIPLPITLLLLVATATCLVVLAFAFVPAQNNRLQIAGLVVVTIMYIGLVEVITELDSPFWGLIDIEATDMSRVARDEYDDFVVRYPGAALPCDEEGRALTAASTSGG